MKLSKRSEEGYFLIDETQSPGTDAVPGGSTFEAGVIRCGHCHRLLLRNPARVRDRFFCGGPKGCGDYVCDFCGDPLQTGCLSLDKIIDRLQEQAFRNLNVKEI